MSPYKAFVETRDGKTYEAHFPTIGRGLSAVGNSIGEAIESLEARLPEVEHKPAPTKRDDKSNVSFEFVDTSVWGVMTTEMEGVPNLRIGCLFPDGKRVDMTVAVYGDETFNEDAWNIKVLGAMRELLRLNRTLTTDYFIKDFNPNEEE
jgi:hypothetical protein